MKFKYITNTAKETRDLGKGLAEKILKTKSKRKAHVLALEGELGGGKTTFLQGFARGMGIREKILSPTFVILKKFKIKHPNFKFFFHIDCYRIKEPKEISDLGFKEIIAGSKNIVAVEWAKRIEKILPPSTTFINFEFYNKNKRKITIKWPKKNA
ncbi:MAG: tRNA (adenosine(37)-N6)-threonylcarbamoyltransferase complex ATPase subunit type 1 TsaE [Candidatus Nealsonbacteria bacterium]